MERFTWATEVSLIPPFLIATGPGYLVMDPVKDPEAIGAPTDIVNGKLSGFLLSAATLLEVQDSEQSRWVMLERDARAPSYPHHWQFPSGRIGPDELPLQCAMRELAEEVRLTYEGVHLPFADVLYRVGGDEYDWLTQDSVHVGIRARQVFYENTVEFYYHATLQVRNVEDVQAFDNEAYGRTVKLLEESEVDALVETGKVCPASALQWSAFKSERAVNRLLREVKALAH